MHVRRFGYLVALFFLVACSASNNGATERGWVAGELRDVPEFSLSDLSTVPTDVDPFVVSISATSKHQLLVLNNEQNYSIELWVKEDGLSWAPMDITGLDKPGDPNSIVSVGEVVLIGGALRVNRVAGASPFSPAIWRSEDLVTWVPSEIETWSSGVVYDIVLTGETLLAVGTDRDGAATWHSADLGLSWSRSSIAPDGVDDEGWDLRTLAVKGETVIAVGERAIDISSSELLIVISSDSGMTWATVSDESVPRVEIDRLTSVVATDRGFWLLGRRSPLALDYPSICYTDLPACDGEERSLLYYSNDGRSWSQVDTSVIGPRGISQIAAAAGGSEGLRILAFPDGNEVWAWQSRQAPPFRTGSPVSESPSYPRISESGLPEIGVTYRYPFGVHCGIDLLGPIDGEWWSLVTSTRGRWPTNEEWPIARETLFGMLTLIDSDTIEYSIGDGEVIATYEPFVGDLQLCA